MISIKTYRFVATTTEGRQINVAYVGTNSSRSAITSAIYDRLKKKYEVHPGRVEELLLLTGS